MNKYLTFLLIVILAGLYYCNVNRRPLEPDAEDQSLRFLSFTDNQCQGEAHGLDKGMASNTFLKNHYMSDDTLTLQIHYHANCCPAFVNTFVVTVDSIVIAVRDTLTGCLCTCEYDNDFKFLYPYHGDLRILFKGWDFHNKLWYTNLDTTIQVN